MNRRAILSGLVAAPFVARLGLLMPVRQLSAATLDPFDINAVIAELPDGARWKAEPGREYWAMGTVNIRHKNGLTLNFAGSTVLVYHPSLYPVHIRETTNCLIESATFVNNPPYPQGPHAQMALLRC